MVYLVGDKPSSKNRSEHIAFVGTPSYPTVMYWIGKLQLDKHSYELINKDKIHSHTEHYRTHIWNARAHKYIALGNEAEKELKKHGVQYFKLPHPSPRNRKINDKEYVNKLLRKCKKWLEIKEKLG